MPADVMSRMAMLATRMAAWSQQCLRRWRNILIRSMCPAGNARQLRPLPMNPRRIWQIIQWYDALNNEWCPWY